MATTPSCRLKHRQSQLLGDKGGSAHDGAKVLDGDAQIHLSAVDVGKQTMSGGRAAEPRIRSDDQIHPACFRSCSETGICAGKTIWEATRLLHPTEESGWIVLRSIDWIRFKSLNSSTPGSSISPVERVFRKPRSLPSTCRTPQVTGASARYQGAMAVPAVVSTKNSS